MVIGKLVVLIVLFEICDGQIQLKTVPEIISNNGYPMETHEFTTEDGYIVQMFRILPNKEKRKNKGPVLMSHGLSGSCLDWLIQGPKKSLGYILSEEGYDVWIISHRGTRSSLKHNTLDAYGETSSSYWNFTLTELAIYDTSTATDYIINATSYSKLYHFGISQGGALFFILLAMKPEYNSKFIAHFSYAPGAFACHMKNPLVKLSSIAEGYQFYTSIRRNIGDFNLGSIVAQLCRSFQTLCFEFLANSGATVSTDVNVLWGKWLPYYPDGFSTKQVIHYTQIVNTCKFQTYADKNQNATEFDLSKVKVPVFAFAGVNDTLQDPEDTAILGSHLPGGFKQFFVIRGFAHLDFATSDTARKRVYEPTLKIMNTL